MNKAAFIGISRLRMYTDGHGITTLVAFHGCPLHCKYCLNPQCLAPSSKVLKLTAKEVFDILKKDELYFIATKGGVTFGGGEPLLNADFIQDLLEMGANRWHTTVETSLNVSIEHIKKLEPYIDEYIIDIKDMNPVIYRKYTGQCNSRVVENIKWLVDHGKRDNITCRIPLIPKFNSSKNQEKSISHLKKLGIKRFDIFDYVTDSKRRHYERQRKMRTVEANTQGVSSAE